MPSKITVQTSIGDEDLRFETTKASKDITSFILLYYLAYFQGFAIKKNGKKNNKEISVLVLFFFRYLGLLQ